jgi:hypothetical protein
LETGKNKNIRKRYGNKLSLAILIPPDSCNIDGVTKHDGVYFYRSHFRKIPFQKYFCFGKLVIVKYVFTFFEEKETVQQYTWEGFYNRDNHIRKWSLLK